MRPVWKENPSPGYQAIKALILGGFALVIVVPILVVISTSLASDKDIINAGGYVLWPSHPTFRAYKTLFSGGLMGRAILVSVFVTLVGCTIRRRPMTDKGSDPARLKCSRTSAS